RTRAAEKRSTIEVFAYAGERSISSQRKARHVSRIFRIDFAGIDFALAAADRHRARRTTGGGRGPGKRGHGILQSTRGDDHTDELCRRAETCRTFESREGERRNARDRSRGGFRDLGNRGSPEVAASARDCGRLGGDDSHNETHYGKIWCARSFRLHRRRPVRSELWQRIR